MIQAYREGKDLYRVLAANVFHNTYEENGEFWEDGTPNPEGKHRRKIAKKLLLGQSYGMGTALLAQNIGCSLEEAQVYNTQFLEGFPQFKNWVEETHKLAHERGYVEGLMGRRRRLPDVQLPRYEVKYKDREKNKTTFFNPLLGSSGINNSLKEDKLVQSLTQRCENAKSRKDIDAIRNEAHANGLEVYDNNGYIATAERQSVNSIIQGSAATMTKKAMVDFAANEWVKTHDAHLMIPIHDELLAEAPSLYADECANKLVEIMVGAAYSLVGDTIPFKCDPTIVIHWYADQITAEYQEYYNDKLIAKGLTDGEAFAKMMEIHSEFTEEQMHQILEGNFI